MQVSISMFVKKKCWSSLNWTVTFHTKQNQKDLLGMRKELLMLKSFWIKYIFGSQVYSYKTITMGIEEDKAWLII